LPMFGHGQIEGFREKYGMEFRKPKLDEMPDEGLIRGHEWKIFPLLHRRYLFADVEQFFLYDLFQSDGGVDENVFAYSNIVHDERGLVLCHNRFGDTRGWIKTSAAYLDKATGDLRQKSLAEGLGLPFEGYVIFKDYITHLEYIRSCEELWQKGWYVELHAYQHHVFMDWRFEDDEQWQAVHDALNGTGVESMQAKWEEMFGEKQEEIETLAPHASAGEEEESKQETEAEVVEEVKAKKPRKKAAVKKKGVTATHPTEEKPVPKVTRRKTKKTN
jgi:hypothetical protein